MLLSLAGILYDNRKRMLFLLFFSSDMVKLNKPFLGVRVMCVCVCVWKGVWCSLRRKAITRLLVYEKKSVN